MCSLVLAYQPRLLKLQRERRLICWPGAPASKSSIANLSDAVTVADNTCASSSSSSPSWLWLDQGRNHVLKDGGVPSAPLLFLPSLPFPSLPSPPPSSALPSPPLPPLPLKLCPSLRMLTCSCFGFIWWDDHWPHPAVENLHVDGMSASCKKLGRHVPPVPPGRCATGLDVQTSWVDN